MWYHNSRGGYDALILAAFLAPYGAAEGGDAGLTGMASAKQISKSGRRDYGRVLGVVCAHSILPQQV